MHATQPSSQKPSSLTYCVSCVVLPLPVSPTTITTWLSLTTGRTSARTEKAGSARRGSATDLRAVNSDALAFVASELPSLTFFA